MKNIKNKSLVQQGVKNSLLTDKQLEKLARQLKSKPPDVGIWTSPKLARWIEK
ncbi:MAG: hypothetical protein SWY16_13040 [Cyanobacteriota bacterium]|nr:hypothetical protein [Cyanobacteriota bacterium]